MKLLTDYSLKNENTFRVDVNSKYFVEIDSMDQINEVLNQPEITNLPILVLGDGANVLFTQDFPGLVIKINIGGIEIVKETSEEVFLEIGAGENWDELVRFVVEKNWGGIENMAMIPGKVGAAAVGNIAAYGQNFIDVFESLDAFNIETKQVEQFNKTTCKFEYRESVFKNELKNKYIITKVRIKLAKNPTIDNSYFETGKTNVAKNSLESELKNFASEPYSIKDVYQAVSNIRKSKLPDPKEIGTAGSFFKNPIVSKSRYEELKKQDPDLQAYPVDKLIYSKSEIADEYVKIPAARLLDNLGWKGKRIGNVGTFPTQALNVVSYGASGKEILEFTKQMQEVVKESCDIILEPEVVIL